MSVVQDRITLGDTLCQGLDPRTGNVWIIHKREDIHKDSLYIRLAEIVALFDIERVAVADLRDRLLASRIRFWGLQVEPVGQFLGSNLLESFFIFQRHTDIDIVIPRYETAMAYGSEQGTAIQPVFYLVALADFVYFFQNSQLLELACPQILLAIFFDFFVKVHILYIFIGKTRVGSLPGL